MAELLVNRAYADALAETSAAMQTSLRCRFREIYGTAGERMVDNMLRTQEQNINEDSRWTISV